MATERRSLCCAEHALQADYRMTSMRRVTSAQAAHHDVCCCCICWSAAIQVPKHWPIQTAVTTFSAIMRDEHRRYFCDFSLHRRSCFKPESKTLVCRPVKNAKNFVTYFLVFLLKIDSLSYCFLFVFRYLNRNFIVGLANQSWFTS